jgi:hypothetical protein
MMYVCIGSEGLNVYMYTTTQRYISMFISVIWLPLKIKEWHFSLSSMDVVKDD